MNKIGPLPNFIYIGPPKSGSTWLFEILRDHPEVFIPISKDLYFFDRYFGKGTNWYKRKFAAANQSYLAIGEVSHDYLFSELASERMAQLIPNAKILSIIRNPFERAISHFKFSIRNGAEFQSFSEGLKKRPTIIEHGLYSKYLPYYLSRFPANQIKIYRFDDVRKAPDLLAKEIFEDLGVSKEHTPKQNARKNNASTPRNKSAAKATHLAAKTLRDLGFTGLIGAVKRSPVTVLLYNTKKTADVHISVDDFNYMKDLFLPDIDRTETLTGIDLTAWKNTKIDDLNT